jgi:predicted enzyme related to lactoylglutathione lyase
MTITLNHTIVPARDKEAAARFFAQIFGLPFEGAGGHFATVRVNDTLTLDFADAEGAIASQHYAFHVSDADSTRSCSGSRPRGSPSVAAPGLSMTGSSMTGTAAAASISRTPTATSLS